MNHEAEHPGSHFSWAPVGYHAVDALEAILVLTKEGEVELGKGMQSQLRVLSEDFNNDIAEVAELILAELA